jgi:hypothetical protein
LRAVITDYETLQEFVDAGLLMVERDEGADFRCPILPNA